MQDIGGILVPSECSLFVFIIFTLNIITQQEVKMYDITCQKINYQSFFGRIRIINQF